MNALLKAYRQMSFCGHFKPKCNILLFCSQDRLCRRKFHSALKNNVCWLKLLLLVRTVAQLEQPCAAGEPPNVSQEDENTVRSRRVCFLFSQNVVDSVFFLELLVLWETDNKSLTSPESFFHVSGLLGRSRTLSSHSTKQNFKICILV